jgi:hypothetical protein
LGERTLAGTHSNDEDAPIPAVQDHGTGRFDPKQSFAAREISVRP